MNSEIWKRFSLAKQIGNIGSELSRAGHWDRRQDRESRNQALERALVLLDLTLNDARWRGRLKELARLREVICDWYADQGEYDISPDALEAYYTSFALLTR